MHVQNQSHDGNRLFSPRCLLISLPSPFFRKLRDVLQQRVIRFLLDQSKKEPEKYSKFFEDYGLFMREGIVTTQEQDVKVCTRALH